MPTHRTRTRFGLLFAVGACALTALIWGRLKLVTGIPRSAYAEPEAAGTPAPIPQRAEPARRQATEPARRRAVEPQRADGARPIGD
ncbi:MAG: hypothetical protein JNM80_05325 [Phycisphaerae bacterium]|nr:hypothetical protein [Phycisphaerae bacterium]